MRKKVIKTISLCSFIPAFIFSAYIIYVGWQDNKFISLLLGSVFAFLGIFAIAFTTILICWVMFKLSIKPAFPYVYHCGDFLRLKNVTKKLLTQTEQLNQLQWKIKGNRCYEADTRKCSREEKAKLLETLNNLGFAFCFWKGRCPSVIFGEYRESGLLSGTYKEISWSWIGPGDFVINEK